MITLQQRGITQLTYLWSLIFHFLNLSIEGSAFPEHVTAQTQLRIYKPKRVRKEELVTNSVCENISMYLSTQCLCYRKGDPFQGPWVVSFLTLRNQWSKETLVLTKQKPLLGRGIQAESRGVRETRRTALACGLKFQGNGVSFWVVSVQSSCLAHIGSASGSFSVACASLSQDGVQLRGFWEVGSCLLPLFGPTWILPAGGVLLVLC